MAAIYIIDQDRENSYIFTGDEKLYTELAEHEGKLIGVNLFMGEDDRNFLGTFDSVDEALGEIYEILKCDTIYHIVTGFEKWWERNPTS